GTLGGGGGGGGAYAVPGGNGGSDAAWDSTYGVGGGGGGGGTYAGSALSGGNGGGGGTYGGGGGGGGSSSNYGTPGLGGAGGGGIIVITYTPKGATTIDATLTPPNLESGLIAHWTFDGADMINNVTDSSRQGNDGDLVGYTSTTTTIGVIGQALSFNGTSQYVAIPAINRTFSSMTITGWIYSNANQNSRTGLVYSHASSGGPGFGISYNSTNELGYEWNNAENTWPSGLFVPNDKWTFVALTVTPSGATIYMGASGSLRSATDAVSLSTEDWNGPIDIGLDTAQASRIFNGSIDDVRVYNRALSASEVKQLYNLGR
ncbi:MAG: LamG domain-containing protein, partial [Pirellulales bacterium]